MYSKPDLDRLIAAMRANGVAALTVESEGQTLCLSLEDAPCTTAANTPISAIEAAKSPNIGRFIARGADDGLPPLSPAQRVAAGETLGYVAQRQVRALVVAPAEGVLASDIPDEGTVFGHGDMVFNVEVSA